MAGRLPTWTFAAAIACVGGCGDDESSSGDGEGAGEHSRSDPKWRRQLQDASAQAVLEALAQGHLAAHDALGPYHLHTKATIELGPAAVPTDDPAPPLDQPVVLPQHVEDEVDLRFSAARGVAFALTQHNDSGRGRDITVVDERVFERRPARGWIEYPLESPLWQQWLDDSWSAVHGAVELAAPRLAVESRVVEGGGWDGGDAIEVTLSKAAERDDALRARGPTQTWRGGASIEAVSGTITFDAASGIWLRAQVEVEYAVDGADGRPQVGKVVVDGAVDAKVGGPITAPSGVQPLPLRERLQAESEQLLEGLARP